MALLAESASGFIFGLHVPDSKLPLLKTMHLDYVTRAQGDLTAIAKITAEQLQAIENKEKGDASIAVEVFDEASEQPVICQMQWAGITKRKK